MKFKQFRFVLILNLFITSNIKSQNVCIPAVSQCNYFGSSVSIDSVSFGSINNISSSCGAGGYTSYYSTIPAAPVMAGTYQPIKVKVGNYSNLSVGVWIDFNHDNQFSYSSSPSDEFFDLGTTGSNGVVSKLIKIPFKALTGTTLMRVRVSYYKLSAGDACSNFAFSETEDYAVNILPNNTSNTGFAIYVKSNSAITNTGSNWTDAYNNISQAVTNSRSGDTIKVARGTYREQINLKDSTIILGGYPNTGNPTNINRNWGTNQTILSGWDGTQYITNIVKGEVLSNQSILDGMIFQDAKGNDLVSTLGVGINLRISNAIIKNCVFRNIETSGGKYVAICDGGSPSFINCFFVNNVNNAYSIILAKQNATAKFNNCVFSENSAQNILISNHSIITISYSTIFKNRYVQLSGDSPIKSRPIFAENSSTINIYNSIFFGNLSNESTDSADIGIISSSINIKNTITQNFNTGSPAFLSINPRFKDTSNVTGPDNLYFTNDDGLQLINPCSFAINNGLNSLIPGVNTDLLGNLRTFGAAVDLGAYEVQSNPLSIPSVIFVNASANGLNNGTSWANAYKDLQTAMLACSDTIKVAAGTYTPAYDNPKSLFWLENKRVIFGGYPNTLNPLDSQRNPILNRSVLSGKLPIGSNIKSQILLRGRNIDSSCVIDGVVISDAGDFNTGKGAIYLTYNASPIFRNTIIKNNISREFASGMIAKINCSPTFIDCTIDSNQASSSDASAMYMSVKSNAKFINCTFKNNSIGIPSGANGGVFNTDNCDLSFDSCIFSDNYAGRYGGCIYSKNNSNPTISNTRFYGNRSALGGAVLFNDGSIPIVNNCQFIGNPAIGGGVFIFNQNNSNAIFNKCEFRQELSSNIGNACLNDHSAPTFFQCAFINSGIGNAISGSVIYNKNYSSPKLVDCVLSAVQGGANISFMSSTKSSPTVINCTIVNKITPFNGSTSTSPFFINSDSTILTIKNSVLWSSNPEMYGTKDIFDGLNCTSIVTNSLLREYGTNGVNGNVVGINPRLVNATDPDGPDNKFLTADDGYSLCSCSPAINTGQNNSINGYSKDLLDNTRISGTTVDMGAIEYQGAVLAINKTYYVNQSSIDGHNGSSWTNAYKEFQSAMLNPCADTIKVAKGIYKPSVSSTDSTFLVNRGIVLLGGYPDVGNPDDTMRNANLNPTILSGDVGVVGDSTDNAYIVMQVNCWDSIVNLDGFTFTQGNNSQSGSGGGLSVLTKKSISIQNCKFLNNYAISGSGLSSIGKTFIKGCYFSNNNSGNGTCSLDGSEVTMKDCIFEMNTSQFGGGLYTKSNILCENTIFYKNTALCGGGVYLNNNPSARFINCNFVKNISQRYTAGAGFWNNGVSSVSRPVLRNCIFKGNSFYTTELTSENGDWFSGMNTNGYLADLDIKNSITLTHMNNNLTNLHPAQVVFKNIDNPIGPDNIWFTADDGLQMESCSAGINSGDNAAVINMPLDISKKTRVYNATVDMGAYESQLSTPILYASNDSLIADFERTDLSGWTHYYKDCQLLLSIKKGTQSGIGSIGDGTFKVIVNTLPTYGSNVATNLSNAAYVSPGIIWNVMNRYWTITPKRQLTDSLLIRFPYSNTDYYDLQGSDSLLTSQQKIVFFKVDSSYTAMSLNVPINKYHQYVIGSEPTSQRWRYSNVDSINYAEFYIKSCGSGTGAVGNGLQMGAFAASNNGCDSSTRLFSSTVVGSSFQWQVNSGSGYIDINNNSNYSGTNTNLLTVVNPPTLWYGYIYRCMIDGVRFDSYNTLKFENIWTGNASSMWENPANWSCGKIPDAFTDVSINSGTVLVNSNVNINSLYVKPGVNFIIATGNILTIIH